jgi:hypothetical protein
MAIGYHAVSGSVWDRLGQGTGLCEPALTPAVIFYLMAQKHIIAGLTSGAVKG